MPNSEFIGLMAGAVLTILILSYLLGDNPLYRLGVHLFVGALVGYSFGILLRDVFYETVLTQLLSDPVSIVAPLVLGILLLIKGLPRHAYIGNFSVAYLVGVGSAVALSGAVLGTIVPQVGATGRALSPASQASLRMGILDSLLIIAGTVCTLMSFTFTAQKQQGLAGVWAWIVRLVAWFGRLFLVVAFGTAFAGAMISALSILIGRIHDLYLLVVVFLGM